MVGIKKSVLLLALLTSTIANASSLSFMIKNDETTESYIKLKNEKEEGYLKLYCNNVFNDIKVSIEGLNEKDYYDQNYYLSKTIFGSNFDQSKWKVAYDKENNFQLTLEDGGFDFAQSFYDEGAVLIDLDHKEDEIRLYTVKNKRYLQQKLSSVFENCSIYF